MKFTKRIGKIAKKYPAMARTVEISLYWAIISLLQFFGDALVTGSFTNYQVAIWMFMTAFVAWVISGVQTYFRRKQEALESN